MKRNVFIFLLGCEAVVLTALAVLASLFPAVFSSMLAFPFEQIAGGLGYLSQFGRVGSGLAAALWVGVSLIPALAALKTRRGRETAKERGALFLLSAVMLPALYGMVNPGLFCPAIPGPREEYFPVVKAALGVTVWSVAVLYVILRLVRKFTGAGKEKLMQYLKALLYILCVFFTANIFAAFISQLIAYLRAAQGALAASMSVVQFVVSSVPYAFDIVITVSAIALLDAALSREEADILKAAARLGRSCCIALGVTAASTAAFDILQVALMRYLQNTAVNVDIPVLSIAFTLIVLLVSRLLAENKRLRDDNALII